MANFFSDNEDLRFYVEKHIDWEPLVRLTEHDYKSEDGLRSVEEAKEMYLDVLNLVGTFAAQEIAPRAQEIDKTHAELKDGVVHFPPVLTKLFDKINELDLHGLAVPRELGGMNAPFMVFMIGNELFARGDVSATAHHSFHGGIAMAMLMYSIAEGSTEFLQDPPRIGKTRFAKEIEEIITGQAWGSMDITEPAAGSDMANLRAKGEQDDEGSWFVTGEKIFITSGHGKYHFVIARTEKAKEDDDDFAGLKGLSLFLVPAFEEKDDGSREHLASFDTLEEKLGHHGSATVSVSYDRSPAQLVGQRGDGFPLMLKLMNNARIGVGFEALGICEAAYRLAKEYAAERPSMGKTIDRHELIADYLDEMRTDIQAIRALAVASAYHEEMAQKLQIHLAAFAPEDEEERTRSEKQLKRHKALARRLTPLLKYLAAEKAVELARRCVQIHGGVGYTTEFGAEKLLRDAMVLPIYEGTSQIQALMVMKDSLTGVIKNPAGFISTGLKARWQAHTRKSTSGRRVADLQAIASSTIQFLITRLAGKKVAELRDQAVTEWPTFVKSWDPKKDFSLALLHAERLTQMLADVAVCELLAEQAEKHPEREELLQRYLERAEPRCKYLQQIITGSGERLLATLSEPENE